MSELNVEASGFAAMGLDPRLMNTLGYKDPTPIQREAIPVLLEGKDLVGLAGTGTGKTAAFALPILHRLRAAKPKKSGVAVLILTPTRELAIQVAKAVKSYGKPIKIEVMAVYGGTGYSEQIRAIRRGAEIIVATPGRALDLIKHGNLPLDAVTTVVLDEADEMLKMGFAEDMDAILSQTPKDRQTMLFSATMPPRIEEIANRHLRNPVRIRVAKERPANGEAAKVRHTAYIVTRENKANALGRILDFEQPTSAIIFCRTRSDVDGLVDLLTNRGYKPLPLHGGLTQDQRDQVMARFRSGKADLLVATDIAARGLDIAQLSHVINFELPKDADQYVHRTGRVGRAGRAGVAITFATARERAGLGQIERATRQKIAIAPIPTVKDLEASRIDVTRQQLREALARVDAPECLRNLVSELAKEFSPTDVAIAALSLLSQPSRPEDKTDFQSGHSTGDVKEEQSRPGMNARDEGMRGGRQTTNSGMAKVYFGIGRESGVQVRDLVTALEEEAGIPGRDIGAIELNKQSAFVEVPSELAEYVVEVMQGARIRRRKFDVRIDRQQMQSAKTEDRVPLGV
jgi:ATP-dependent RNA helicase DeaD